MVQAEGVFEGNLYDALPQQRRQKLSLTSSDPTTTNSEIDHWSWFSKSYLGHKI